MAKTAICRRMAGSLIDLNRGGALRAGALVLDTSVVVTRFLPALRTGGSLEVARRDRVAPLLAMLSGPGSLAFIAAATFVELVHLVIVAGYKTDLRRLPDPATGRRFPAWTALYTQRPDLVRRYTADVEALRLAISAAGLFVLQPGDLSEIECGRRIEQEVIRLVRRDRIDSADATMHMEARRAGIDSILAEDRDIRRAARDFDVYTWL